MDLRDVDLISTTIRRRKMVTQGYFQFLVEEIISDFAVLLENEIPNFDRREFIERCDRLNPEKTRVLLKKYKEMED